MENVKPITSTQIFIARIKGIFPFMIPLTYLQLLFGALFYFGIINKWIVMIPYSMVVLYYILYLGFIVLARFLLWLISKIKK